jgi:hypothetical protein
MSVTTMAFSNMLLDKTFANKLAVVNGLSTTESSFQPQLQHLFRRSRASTTKPNRQPKT